MIAGIAIAISAYVLYTRKQHLDELDTLWVEIQQAKQALNRVRREAEAQFDRLQAELSE